MSDIRRSPDRASVHNVHTHNCPNCRRNYSCNCSLQPGERSLVCIDCEHGVYNPAIHGGSGQKEEA